MPDSPPTTNPGPDPDRDIEELLRRFREGDPAARDELINLSYERFRRLAQRMLNAYPRLRRYMETGDVLNGAMSPLLRALGEIRPESPGHFFNLAALQIRRHLLDLTRRYFGQYGPGSKHDTGGLPADDTGGALHSAQQHTDAVKSLEEWTAFHEAVGVLPADQRAVMDLLWYQGLRQQDAARLLGVDVRTVKRWWRAACAAVQRTVSGDDTREGRA